MSEREMITDLTDMLTDWCYEQMQNICVTCRRNKDTGTGTTECISDFDPFECEYTQCDLKQEIENAAMTIATSLPIPDEE